jgi:hypothetical protein
MVEDLARFLVDTNDIYVLWDEKRYKDTYARSHVIGLYNVSPSKVNKGSSSQRHNWLDAHATEPKAMRRLFLGRYIKSTALEADN